MNRSSKYIYIIGEDRLEQACVTSLSPNDKIVVAVVDSTLRCAIGPVEVLSSTISELKLSELDSAHPEAARGFLIRDSKTHGTDRNCLVAFRMDSSKNFSYRTILSRDLHYRGPRGEDEYELPKTDGYQVLGDHIAASMDSRQLYKQGVPKAAILGRVKRDPSATKED